MTLKQLRYITVVADTGNITEKESEKTESEKEEKKDEE